MKKRASEGIAVGRWWALVRGPKALPVCFASRADAVANRDPDEYLVRIWAVPARCKDHVKRAAARG